MTTLRFTINFHGPFRVGGAATAGGLDAPVNRENLLPASSLKGVMRAEAKERLGLPATLVNEVFGHSQRRSPWWWSDADLGETEIRLSSKVKVDDRGRAERGFVRFSEQVWADKATFTVEQTGAIAPDRMAVHQVVLQASAASVTALGASRRRGEGWVSIASDGLADIDLTLLLGAR